MNGMRRNELYRQVCDWQVSGELLRWKYMALLLVV